jgi:hypothetical protein
MHRLGKAHLFGVGLAQPLPILTGDLRLAWFYAGEAQLIWLKYAEGGLMKS